MNGVTVAIKHGSDKAKLVSLGTAKTGADGAFAKSVLLQKPSYFQVGATTGVRDLGAGQCAASFGVPCLDATVGGTSFVSRLIHVNR